MLLAAFSALSGSVMAYEQQDSGVPPSNNAGLLEVLEVSKLQAPTSDDKVDDLLGWSSKYFYLEPYNEVRQAVLLAV